MANLPEHYESLGLTASATPAEIERAYQSRAAKLRALQVQDAPEELAEVEAAYSGLWDPAKRAQYDLEVREADREENTKYAELDAQLHRNRHHHRKHVDGISGWLDAIWAIFKFFG
jgi:DnaJ-class molecular chaperone